MAAASQAGSGGAPPRRFAAFAGNLQQTGARTPRNASPSREEEQQTRRFENGADAAALRLKLRLIKLGAHLCICSARCDGPTLLSTLQARCTCAARSAVSIASARAKPVRPDRGAPLTRAKAALHSERREAARASATYNRRAHRR